jgi:Prion-inhibition and propagation
MPFGADDIVGVVALSLTGLHASVKGLTIISKANHYDRDVSNIRLQIELEQHSLFTWAEAVGLTQDPPTLQMSANDAAYVPEILQRLDGLLDNLDQLKKLYGLELRPTSADVEALDDESSTE